jgi:hypothetical protein
MELRRCPHLRCPSRVFLCSEVRENPEAFLDRRPRIMSNLPRSPMRACRRGAQTSAAPTRPPRGPRRRRMSPRPHRGSVGVGDVLLGPPAIARPGDGLRVVARAGDGVIEAVEHADHLWCINMQLHPEMQRDEPSARRPSAPSSRRRCGSAPHGWNSPRPSGKDSPASMVSGGPGSPPAKGMRRTVPVLRPGPMLLSSITIPRSA